MEVLSFMVGFVLFSLLLFASLFLWVGIVFLVKAAIYQLKNKNGGSFDPWE